MIPLILGAIAAGILPYAWVGIAVLLMILAFLIFGDKYILPIIIVAYLIVTSDISEELRIAVNILGLLILCYKFIKEYGFKLDSYKKFPNIVSYFIIYTILISILSSLFSTHPLISYVEVFRLIVFLIMMYFFYSFIKNTNDVKAYLYSLLIAGIILSFTILFFFISSGTDISTLIAVGLVHEGGYYKNVAAVGGIFTITVSINFALLFYENSKGKRIKIFLWLTLILQIIALLLTNSRAAFMGVFFSSVFIFTKLNWKLFRRIFYSFAGFSLIIISLFPNIINIIATFIRAGRVLQNTRYYMWDISLSIIKNNPVLGCGPGMFKFYIYKYLPVMLGSWTESQIYWLYNVIDEGHSHNYLLYKASETGMLGLVSAIALPVIFFYLSYKVYKAVKENKYWSIILIAIIGSGIGLLMRSIFEATGFLTDGWITRDMPFWILFITVIFLYQRLIVSKHGLEEL